MKDKIVLDRDYICMIFDELTRGEQEAFASGLIRLYLYDEQPNTSNKYLDLLIKASCKYCELDEINSNIPVKVVEGGIYGIYYNQELVYIGKTIRDFKLRFKEHYNHMIKKDDSMKLYNNTIIKDINQIEFKVLFDVKECKNKNLTENDILAMELCLITMKKSVLNKQWT